MKKFLLASAIALSLTSMTPALAEHHGDGGHHGYGDSKKYEELKKMTPEERQKFFEEKKAKWQALSKEDKIKEIEKRRAERIKAMDEHWKSLSDDEKISFVEKRMERKGKRFDGHGGKGSGPADKPATVTK